MKRAVLEAVVEFDISGSEFRPRDFLNFFLFTSPFSPINKSFSLSFLFSVLAAGLVSNRLATTLFFLFFALNLFFPFNRSGFVLLGGEWNGLFFPLKFLGGGIMESKVHLDEVSSDESHRSCLIDFRLSNMDFRWTTLSVSIGSNLESLEFSLT